MHIQYKIIQVGTDQNYIVQETSHHDQGKKGDINYFLVNNLEEVMNIAIESNADTFSIDLSRNKADLGDAFTVNL